MKASLVHVSGFVALGILAGSAVASPPDMPPGPTPTVLSALPGEGQAAVTPKPSELIQPQAELGAVPLDPESDGNGPRSGLLGGASFYYLKPYLPNNTAFRTTTMPDTPMSQVVDTTFSWNYEPAAAFWLGWAPDNGLGLRARYFFFDQTSPTLNVSNTTTPPPQTTISLPLASFLPLSSGGIAFGSPGTVLSTGIGTDRITFSSTLEIHTLDLEATYGWRGDRWSVLAGAGGRYEVLNQGFHAQLINNGAGLPIFESQVFDATRNFSGGGPVGSILTNLRIGQTNFSLYGSLCGAVLIGTNQERVNYNQTVFDPTGLIPPGIPGTLQITPTARRDGDRVLSVAEIELGMQYDLNLRRSSLFVRAGVVDQNYFDAGNASQTTGDMSLFGVQFSAGLRR